MARVNGAIPLKYAQSVFEARGPDMHDATERAIDIANRNQSQREQKRKGRNLQHVHSWVL